MISVSEQKERHVLELHNQGKNSREIAKIARISFREIGKILRNADKQKEADQERARKELLSSQAYKLFSKGKTPAEVAIELKIRAPQAIDFCREYWDLVRLDNLNQIYQEIRHNIQYFVELYRLAKAGGFRVEHVVRLLRTANSDLPILDCKYESLKKEVNSLEERKRNSGIKLQELHNQITEVTNYVEHCRASYRQEETKMKILRQRRMELEALVKQFENNNQQYIKIRKTVEEKILTTLSDRKALLTLALLCLTKSMRNNPEKYNSLIYYGGSSTRGYSRPYSGASHLYGQQQYQSKNYGSEDYMTMLVEEADKLWNILPKELVDQIITEYCTANGSSLPSLPPLDEE
ncbi:MAG TPA: hypothetical protein VFI73_05750 [Candidatus Nitrosopolaris sp.]|nr:hypothetical protein [Candidatus Nitrosopolaris sp.]